MIIIFFFFHYFLLFFSIALLLYSIVSEINGELLLYIYTLKFENVCWKVKKESYSIHTIIKRKIRSKWAVSKTTKMCFSLSRPCSCKTFSSCAIIQENNATAAFWRRTKQCTCCDRSWCNHTISTSLQCVDCIRILNNGEKNKIRLYANEIIYALIVFSPQQPCIKNVRMYNWKIPKIRITNI